MSLMSEYMGKSYNELEIDLMALIKRYNDYTNSNLFLYVSAIGKQVPEIALDQSDFYVIRDLLKDFNSRELHILIETPGGSGEAAEEIVRYIREHFDSVSFIVVGEAKSAGTIIVLSGNEIYMTETGSLGPIDAQVFIGRSVSSAYDYVEWIRAKHEEAAKTGQLNPFDAMMIAQITPGELVGVENSLNFAQDLVVDWLSAYKFSKWNETEIKKIPVTQEMKRDRAKQIAEALCNRTKWRSHGRSIKIRDLQEIGLKINCIDDDAELSDIVYRIHTVYRLIFDSDPTFKILGTVDKIISKVANPFNQRNEEAIIQENNAEIVIINQTCPKCNDVHKIYCKLADPEVYEKFQKEDFKPYPQDDKILCKCSFAIDTLLIKNDIEEKTNKKII